MSKKTIFNVAIVIVLVTLAFFIYQFFIKGTGAPPPEAGAPRLISSNELAGRPRGPAGADPTDEFLNILLSLQKLELKTDLFADPLFRSLTDFSTALPERQAGRSNPFAPIGVGGPPASPSLGGPSRSAATTSVGRSPGAPPPPAGSEGDLREQLLRSLGE